MFKTDMLALYSTGRASSGSGQILPARDRRVLLEKKITYAKKKNWREKNASGEEERGLSRRNLLGKSAGKTNWKPIRRPNGLAIL